MAFCDGTTVRKGHFEVHYRQDDRCWVHYLIVNLDEIQKYNFVIVYNELGDSASLRKVGPVEIISAGQTMSGMFNASVHDVNITFYDVSDSTVIQVWPGPDGWGANPTVTPAKIGVEASAGDAGKSQLAAFNRIASGYIAASEEYSKKLREFVDEAINTGTYENFTFIDADKIDSDVAECRQVYTE